MKHWKDIAFGLFVSLTLAACYGEEDSFATPDIYKDYQPVLKDGNTGLPAGRRRRHRHGSNQRRQATHRQRIGRYFFFLYDRIGKRVVEAIRNDRHGHHSRRKPRSHGTLQQLYFGS